MDTAVSSILRGMVSRHPLPDPPICVLPWPEWTPVRRPPQQGSGGWQCCGPVGGVSTSFLPILSPWAPQEGSVLGQSLVSLIVPH